MKIQKRVLAVAIGSIAAIAVACILGNAYKGRSKPERRIVVQGMAEKNFSADLIVWNGYFSKQNMDMKVAFKQLKSDEELVRKYLIDQGISEKEIVFSSVDISKEYNSYYSDGHYVQVFEGFRLIQNIKITSNDLTKVENVSRGVSSLIDSGVEFISESPNFYYTKLADLKLELIQEATKDGRQRAEKIAQNANSKLGKLQTAELGVFQITGQNSNEDYSWGGTYNTKSKDKTANITVKLKFEPR
ncbi:MAG: SIMPL domain-containing protein [Bacteroidales bacterium]|nr:SIMPL domain-containing protein [Bacteroidales bacterium]